MTVSMKDTVFHLSVNMMNVLNMFLVLDEMGSIES